MEKPLDLVGWLEDDEKPLYLIGGGGKSTTMAHLAARLDEAGRPCLMATTTKVIVGQFGPLEAYGGKDLGGLVRALSQHFLAKDKGAGPALAYHHIWSEKNKYCGHDPRFLEALLEALRKSLAESLAESQGASLSEPPWLLIEADGARNLPLKAPYDHEPVIGTGTVLALVGAQALGAPLDKDHAYGLDNILSILGKEEGQALEVEDLVGLILSPRGYRKGLSPGQTFKVIINQAEGKEQKQALLVKERLKKEGIEAKVISLVEEKEYVR